MSEASQSIQWFPGHMAKTRRKIKEILPLIDAVAERNLEKAFMAFCSDPLVTCNLSEAKKLFDEMIENTKKYLTMYFE